MKCCQKQKVISNTKIFIKILFNLLITRKVFKLFRQTCFSLLTTMLEIFHFLNFTQFISFYEFLDIAQKGYIHLTCLGMQSFNL